MDKIELQLNNPDEERKGLGAVFGLIKKHLFLIILIIVLAVSCGYGLARLRDKTVYKATTTVMLRASLNKEELTASSTDISLAKLILPDAKRVLKSDEVIKGANEEYYSFLKENDIKNGGRISAGSISIKSNSNSLILTISYSDYSERNAINKLNCFIKSAQIKENLEPIPANILDLKSVQNEPTITQSNSFWRYITLSFLAGLGIAFLIVFAMGVLDTTVKSKKELEGITDTILLAYIDDTVLYSKRHKSGY